MGALSNIKAKAKRVKESVSSKDASKLQFGKNSEDSSDEDLSGERERVSQEEARRERARVEARREAKREKQEQELEQVREEARQAVLDEQESGDSGGILDQAITAVSEVAEDIDLDGDGVPLEEEILDNNQQAPAQNRNAGSSQGSSGGNQRAADQQDDMFAGAAGMEQEKELLRAAGFDVENNNGDADNMSNVPEEDAGMGTPQEDESGDPLGLGFDAAEQLGMDDPEDGGL